jgi:opacity protein-like surface antigen
MRRTYMSHVKKILFLSTCILSSTTALASNQMVHWPQFYDAPWRPVIILGAGAGITSDLGTTNNFPIINPATDEFYQYRPKNSTATVGMFDAFIGGECAITDKWKLQTGIGYDVETAFNVSGLLNQGADAQSADNYNYSYQIQSQQLMLLGKALYQIRDRYHPYVMLGLGASFNNSYHFSTGAPRQLTFTRDFNNHLNTAFTYSAGLGVDVDVAENMRVGLGYRFADFGQSNLGSSSINNVPVSGQISQSHLYVNQVLAEFTYIA